MDVAQWKVCVLVTVRFGVLYETPGLYIKQTWRRAAVTQAGEYLTNRSISETMHPLCQNNAPCTAFMFFFAQMRRLPRGIQAPLFLCLPSKKNNNNKTW
jgi:hypothetical protein